MKLADIEAYSKQLAEKARTELAQIKAGTKEYLTPDQWQPAAFSAQAPSKGVTLDGGPMREMFDRCIDYIKEWWTFKDGYRNREAFIRVCDDDAVSAESLAGETVGAESMRGWEKNLPASSEGRMLAVAAHLLRWEEREDMRAIVDAVVEIIKRRQRDDGYCMPFPEKDFLGSENAWIDERKNYDRVNLTRGLIAAGNIGNTDAYAILRKFYDWLNASPYLLNLLAGPNDNGSAHNCNNGHEGHLLMHFSPVGKPEDLVAAERVYVQDFFIDASINREAYSLSHYPFHVAHSYVLLAYKAWMDHYRATGHQKYLEAAKGAWDIVHDHYLHAGGSIGICESRCGMYPPDSLFIHATQDHHTGETCGSVFWADINHRLLQHFPTEAKYADEIEQAVINNLMANMTPENKVRYHARMEKKKQGGHSVNTCCEVMGAPFIASLPQYIYSVAPDGLYVNLFAPSTITAEIAGRQITLKQVTAFPLEMRVTCRVEHVDPASEPATASLHVRIPCWCKGDVEIRVNGNVVTTGTPGSYARIAREWQEGDVLSLDLKPVFEMKLYEGHDKSGDYERYSLMYGPVLMALVGAENLRIPPKELIEKLKPVEGKALHYSIAGVDHAYVMPYWLIDKEYFTCYPSFA